MGVDWWRPRLVRCCLRMIIGVIVVLAPRHPPLHYNSPRLSHSQPPTMAFDKPRRRRCFAAGRVTAQLLLSFLTLSPGAAGWGFGGGQTPLLPLEPFQPESATGRSSKDASNPGKGRFTLRHIVHRGGKEYPTLHRRLDVRPDEISAAIAAGDGQEAGIGPYEIRSSSVLIPRLRERAVDDIAPLLYVAQTYGETVSYPEESWTVDDVPSPNITDRDTVINFSLMAGSAYNKDPSDPEWEYPKPPFNVSSDVGWESDGIRGHVFANDDNSTIVLSIKGTTSAVFDGAETTTNDKENDNLFAGCCCGQGEHYLWRQVCDCMTSAYTCNETCVVQAMRKPSRYYASSIELYGNVTEMYPDADVYLTGHSLGGLVSALLGLTFGLPVVTFEAVPQALAAKRLGLPTPPGYQSAVHARQNAGVWNFGHTADPVYMGTCNAASSVCTIAGYALQSVCHVGQRCEYNTVEEWQWRMSMTTHGIRGCIRDVYRAWEGVPSCEPDEECVDCFNWKRYHSNGSELTTTTTHSTSTTSTILTRTETCKTPGWWGCLDPTTSTSTTTTRTSTTTVTSETCRSRGWFGNCLDPVTTTFTTTTTILPPAVTTTETTATATTATTNAPTVSTCGTPGFFWGCHDRTTDAKPHAITEAPEHDIIL